MSVEQTEVVDLMSIDPKSGKVVLTISDHLEWSNSVEHQQILQRKLNAYLAFVESGDILQRYPESTGKPVCFKMVFKHKPDQEGKLFIGRARQVIESAGFSLEDELFAESWNN